MHPATLYGFITAAIVAVGIIVLMAIGNVSASEGLPILGVIAGVGGGVAGGVAAPSAGSDSTGTVTLADPEA